MSLQMSEEKAIFLEMAKKQFRKKALSFALSRGLIAVVSKEVKELSRKITEEKNQNSGDMERLERLLRIQNSYENSYHCTKKLLPVVNKTGDKTRLMGKRCRARWCATCQSILMYNLMNKYGKAIMEMKDPYFVTLTAPTVKGREGLEERVKEFFEAFKAIRKDRYWQKHKPNGIKKIECTVRPKDKYHYHFHIVIDGKDNAQWLQKQWLKRIPKAKHVAQDIRPVEKGEDGLQGSVLEIFKYFTKLTVKDARIGKTDIPYNRLHTIFTTLYGKSTFQTFGKIKQESEEEFGKLISKHVPKEYFKEWGWMQSKLLKVNGVGYVDEDKNVLTGDYKLPEWVGNASREMDKQEEEKKLIIGEKWECKMPNRELTKAEKLVYEIKDMIREEAAAKAKKAQETIRERERRGEAKQSEWIVVRSPKKPPQKQGVEGEYPPDYEEP